MDLKNSYHHSELGWHPNKKKKEMKHPAMRYLLLFDRSITTNEQDEDEDEEEKKSDDMKDEKGDKEAPHDNNNDDTLAKVKISSSDKDELRANGEQVEGSVSQTIHDIEDNSDTEDDQDWEDASTSSSSSSPSSSTLLKSSRSKALTQSTTTSQIVGFLSFMITDEEGAEVIYTYELDIHPSYQKLGLGKRLMVIMEAFGDKVQVEKSMLTCFDSNVGARRFYEKIGYVNLCYQSFIYAHILPWNGSNSFLPLLRLLGPPKLLGSDVYKL